MVETNYSVWYNWFVGYVYFWWWCSYVVDLSCSYDLFTILFEVYYFIVLFIGGWLGYEMAGFAFGDNLFSMRLYVASSFAGSKWIIPFFSTYGVSFVPLGISYRATKVFDSG
jgi:hypothetical protein